MAISVGTVRPPVATVSMRKVSLNPTGFLTSASVNERPR